MLRFPDEIEWFSPPEAAIVQAQISPYQEGQIEWRGSFWSAQFYQLDSAEALPETPVKVIGRKLLTLLVVPA